MSLPFNTAHWTRKQVIEFARSESHLTLQRACEMYERYNMPWDQVMQVAAITLSKQLEATQKEIIRLSRLNPHSELVNIDKEDEG